ncbi:DUF4112 domain-containing protein [Pyxidicoccus fallax]|uniref:DUF4112 domain-containing protein n=1 Tax=Pyxidicoccus fallax TaxID=394095 RepID=A0A848LJM0_9BACT|nr:DUF4112 domain-containing protein [Pyxidicoccus fallax]NMO17919.1 DUF4112 domain-containing protein [Pyxidicoccus fallax]NPC79755.1 DUF4112 domain-containing protein [Pyxidicoccus fallax]
MALVRTPPDTASLAQVRRLSQFLDNSIPLPGGARVGWDAVIGLVPGVGDVAGVLLSGFIVLQAQRLGASPSVLTRMLGNLAIEAVVGSVPFLGDLFDAAFKANVRNVRLLEQHMTTPQTARRASRAWVFAIVATMVVLLGLGLTLTVLVVRALLSLGNGG